MNTQPVLEPWIDGRHVWRGRTPRVSSGAQLPTGWAALDDILPGGGWPAAALTEILLPLDGVGELRLLWPSLAHLSQQGPVVLIAPPYALLAPAWHAAGVSLDSLQVIRPHVGNERSLDKSDRQALWAAEQCLRSGACRAVVCWPQWADDRALRRLQVAAESGQCPGFLFRSIQAAHNPSPAALRLQLHVRPAEVQVLKCRGGWAGQRLRLV
ncbi:MAG: hypothetical protein BWZ07_00760 [Alphaproteobacteria bacterium ADurb.BinA280]|jgi:hypothetical protein|nr:translesion DNA synthesis-associated protein ImuA [Xanthomonadales bacterium]MCC6506619.1 translesion DNA synthesis-associated protein ImuA [Aquimonas sp.]OPZ13192.1 MAG: hypothetical protein BWZ07_00760 [Alphaproteobacteria bacterium ADurb.BinA280]